MIILMLNILNDKKFVSYIVVFIFNLVITKK